MNKLFMKRLSAVGFVVLLFLSAFLILGGLQAEGSSINSSSGLSGTISSTNMFQVAFGTNGSVYKQATATLDNTTHTITLQFPVGFKVSHIVIFSSNTTLDSKHLLEQSNYYIYNKISVSNAKLNSAFILLGSVHNSSSLNAINDKSVTGVVDNLTIYNSNTTTNNLGESVDYSLLAMASGNLQATQNWVINLNETGFNSSASTSVILTSYNQHPFTLNILDILSYSMLVVALIGIVLVFFSIPRIKGHANIAKMEKREGTGIILGLVVLGVTYLISYFEGLSAGSDLVMTGFGLTLFFGSAMGTYFTGMMEEKIQYGKLIAGLIIGGIVAFISTYAVPFMSPIANIAGFDFSGQVTEVIIVLLGIAMMGAGFAVAKRTHGEYE